jgi:hypothetical protein
MFPLIFTTTTLARALPERRAAFATPWAVYAGEWLITT